MTHKPVQAVFFWRAEMTSVFKATYGRLQGSTSYTKDFLQPRGNMARALERALGLDEGVGGPVEWRWPGGSYTGGKLLPAADFHESNGRLNLRWQTDNPPPPWRLTQHPNETTLSTLRGDPDFETEAQADAQRDQLIASDERPWLIAVHLFGEGPVLHARVVLENPAPGRQFAAWENLPQEVRNAMAVLPRNKPGDYVEFEEGYVTRAGAIVDRIMRAFAENPNVLLVGPPGTGKTVAMEDVKRVFKEGRGVAFDPDALHGAFSAPPAAEGGETRVRSVVFHPSYAYEDFVMGLLPDPTDVGVTVKPRVGPLLELAHYASHPGRWALLICDEFNRGAAASTFGDTLGLLDHDKRSTPGRPESGAEIETPYGHLNPETSAGDKLPSQMSLPKSLYILAAMNSADRSVAPLDAALRRRFSIVYIEPDYEVLSEHLGIPRDFELGELESWDTADHIKALGVQVLRGINERIEAVSGRDFLLGQSVLWQVGGTDRNSVLKSLARAMDDRVIGTLTLTYTDNDGALAAVLNVDPGGGSAETDETGGNGAATWHAPNDLIREVASPRLRVVSFTELPEKQLVQVLSSLL
ncbi:McrB family protein [Geodermatophilus sp. SYSU D00079]